MLIKPTRQHFEMKEQIRAQLGSIGGSMLIAAESNFDFCLKMKNDRVAPCLFCST